ncbi:MerR family transcriptional regulator [Saccharibacillus sp. O16]|nr:MerR family transcriptional regulator [Saccharibacillus sp. O16]
MDKYAKGIYLTTGEFAKLCGVNKRTLFHYDDIGLLKPSFTDEKGYRFYSYRQLDVFVLIHGLKELKLPLKDVRDYMDSRTPQHMIDMAARELPHIREEIDKLHGIRRMLEETIVLAEEGLAAREGEFRMEHQAEERLIRSGPIADGDSDESDPDRTNEFRRFDQLTRSDASSFIGTMIEMQESSGTDDPTFFFFVRTNKKRKGLTTFIKPEGRYAVGYHFGSYEQLEDTYAEMLRWIDGQGLRPGRFGYEEYLIDDAAVKDEAEYVTRITLEVRI